jgi:DHA3 family multidrug efflux protein-like MFS transporter
MMGSSAASLGFYAVGFVILITAPEGSLANVASLHLWAFVLVVMLGVIAGNIRSIALTTLVTVLIPEDRRDRANGMVGMVTGLGFLTTSVISGFLVAWTGMLGVMVFALVLTVLALAHIASVPINEPRPERVSGAPAAPRRVDIAGTILVISAVPGLFALILFATFNNFLGGIFMALLDAYGLSLVSVELWGLTFGFTSTAFILSGLLIARYGLGKSPLRTLLLVNLVVWSTCAVFTIQHSYWLLLAGCFIWMLLSPFAEAAEHTTLQRVVPLERQGRVFGFAQSVEASASPLTAFLIGPLTEFVVIPFMTNGAGATAIGGWFGTGPARGIALVFTVGGVLGLIMTIIAFRSRQYRELSAVYANAPEAGDAEATASPA